MSRPYDGYHQLAPPPVAIRDAGDAQARMQVRIEEIDTALDLARHAVGRLPDCDVERLQVPVPPASGQAVGWAEAPQGELLYLLELAGGQISYCAPRSASFHNLMLFPATFVGDILTDWPTRCRWRWPVLWWRSPPGSPRWRSSGLSGSSCSGRAKGPRRSGAVTSVRWAPPGLALLGVSCVGVAVVAPLWIRVLIAGLDPVVGRDVATGALKSDWVLQPVYPEFSSLSPSWLVVVMPVLGDRWAHRRPAPRCRRCSPGLHQ